LNRSRLEAQTGRAYRPHQPNASSLLVELFQGFQAEGLAMPFTMEDFLREFAKKQFRRLSPTEKAEVLQELTPEQRLAGLTPEQILTYLNRLSAKPPARKPLRKK
jgi:hypothetical protein